REDREDIELHGTQQCLGFPERIAKPYETVRSDAVVVHGALPTSVAALPFRQGDVLWLSAPRWQRQIRPTSNCERPHRPLADARRSADRWRRRRCHLRYAPATPPACRANRRTPPPPRIGAPESPLLRRWVRRVRPASVPCWSPSETA